MLATKKGDVMGIVNKIKLEIDYDGFCSWYFSDMGRSELASVVEDLIDDGKISVKGYLDNVEYIPYNVIVNKDDVILCDMNEERDELENLSNYNIDFKKG